MRRWLIMLTTLSVGIALSGNVFSATYDATGIWQYTTTLVSSTCTDPNESETGLTAIEQNEDTFTFTDRWGIASGRIDGAYYTATKSWPDSFGVTTESIFVTLESDTYGFGIITWTWTDGVGSCGGSSTIEMTKQPSAVTYDATGIWDYSTSNHWNDCNDPNTPETGSVSITQNGNAFRFVYRGTESGLVSGETYIGVVAYPEDGGTTTESIFFTLSSNTSGTGSVGWFWTDGIDYCYGTNDFTVSKKEILNNPPSKPALSAPSNGADNLSLTPTLETGSFSDPDSGAAHKQTEWQISKESDFSSTELITKSASQLTSLIVPKFVLKVDTTYYWRVRFYDNQSTGSSWSSVYSFTTTTVTNDPDGDGIPDSQENNTVDLDGDGTPDSQQGHIKSLNTVVGNVQMGVSRKDDPTVTTIGSIESIDPATISNIARPYYMPWGLLGAELTVLSPSNPAEITIYFSQAVPNGMKWYVHNSVDGWTDYSKQATFSSDRKSVLVKLKDWGYGDSDGIPNGVVVDPGGIGLASWIDGSVTDSSTGQPINNAVITIRDLILRTLFDGNYLSMILPGEYSISVSADGYESLDIDRIEIPEGVIITKDFALSPLTKPMPWILLLLMGD